MSDYLFKLSSHVAADHADFVEGFIHENSPSSWALMTNHITGESLLTGFFKTQKILLRERSFIEDEIGSFVKLFFSEEKIENQDWQNAYKYHFKPWSYNRFHLVPSWLSNSHVVPNGEISMKLDPGMAFGTGNHETTRMCLELIIENYGQANRSKCLIDLGCGSGILSIASALLGFNHVIGIDNDLDAIRISKENASLNKVLEKTIFKFGNLKKLDNRIGKFDWIVANIQADVLIESAEEIVSLAKCNSHIILSGILHDEVEQVIGAFQEYLNNEVASFHTRVCGEWTSIQFIVQ